jgi:transposase
VTALEEKLSKEVSNLSAEVAALKARLDYTLRQLYGSKSEKTDLGQLPLGLAGVEEEPSPGEEPSSEPAAGKARPSRKGHSRAKLPETLEERTVYIDPEHVRAAPDDFREIDRETSEQLDIEPPRLVKVTTIRRKYVRKDDPAGKPAIAPMPPRPIDKGLPTARLLAWVVVSKYCDHAPLYRQEKAFKRLGCAVSRKTMSDWVESVEFWLAGIVELMKCQLLAGNYIQADETPVKYMDEDIARKRCGEGYLWGISAPGEDIVFHWATSRARAVATSLLGGYAGLLQCDGYQAYEKVDATRIACMAHVRRYFEKAQSEDPAFATFVMHAIRNLYRAEAKARKAGLSPKLRARLRQSESAMTFRLLGKAIARRQGRYLPKSAMGKAVAYALGQWGAMSRYLEYGQAEIDNNLMENAIRPTAVGKKNWMFVGHPKAGSRSAVIYSIVGSCERRGINPFEYIHDVLERIPSMKASEQYKLTPQNWAKHRPVKQES